jgi:hypothetical protein
MNIITLASVVTLSASSLIGRTFPLTNPLPQVVRQAQISNAPVKTSVTIPSFKATLDRASDYLNVTILAEGRPFKTELPDKEAKILLSTIERLSQTEEPIDPSQGFEALKTIADLYDYSAEQSGTHVFVLRKRYTDPSDLPVVTYADCVHSLQEILRITSLYCPVKSIPEPFSKAVYESFSSEELTQELLNKPLTELSESQQEAIREYAVRTYLDSPTMYSDFALKHLLALKERSGTLCAFQYFEFQGLNAFGYKAPFGIKRTMLPFVLSHGIVSSPSGSMHTTLLPINGKLRSSMVDSFDPIAIANSPAYKSRLPFFTLDSLFQKEQNKEKENQSKASAFQPVIVVHKDLAARNIVVSGESNASKLEMAKAISKAFGFRLAKDPRQEVYYMTPPALPQVKSIRDLPEAIRQLLPEPMVRAVNVANTPSKDSEQRFLDAEDNSPMLKEWLGGTNEAQKNLVREVIKNQQSIAQPEIMYREAARRLRVLVEPRVQTILTTPGQPQSENKLKMSEIGDEEWNLLAILGVADCMNKLVEISDKPIPEYLTEWDPSKISVSAGLRKNPSNQNNIFGLMLKYQDNTGRKITIGPTNLSAPLK